MLACCVLLALLMVCRVLVVASPSCEERPEPRSAPVEEAQSDALERFWPRAGWLGSMLLLQRLEKQMVGGQQLYVELK